MSEQIFDDVWEIVVGGHARVSVNVLLDDSNDGDSYRGRCLSWVASEVLLDFSHDFEHLPWLSSSWSVASWFRYSQLLDDLGDFRVSFDNSSGWSDHSWSHVSEKVFHNKWIVVLWAVFRMLVDELSDDLDDGDTDRGIAN